MMMMYLQMLLSTLGGPMLVVGAVAALVWFVGPHVGLESVVLRVWIIVAVAVAVLGFVGLRALVKWRRKKKIQAQLDAAAGIAEGDDGPAPDLSLDARLRRLVQAWRREDPGLLQRPWYLVLGPRGAGRRSLLAASGSGLREAGELFAADEDGAREASFWRTENAVFVCPDADYIDDADRRGAYGDLIAALRRAVGSPDGVVLTLDLPRLLDAGEDEIAALARTLRERYDHLAERGGRVFPVSLVLTQCDQLHGFVDYFDHLGKDDRADALGLVLPYRKDEPAAVVRRVGERFAELYQSLRLRRVAGIASDGDHAARERAARFPIQFLSLRPRLELFVAELLGLRPEIETGILRGVFFTSTTQSGTTRDRALGSWDPELVVGTGAHPIAVGDQRSYFATGLLGRILPADGGLAYPRAADAARQRLKVRGWAAGSLAVAALLVVALGISFVNNGRLLVEVQKAAIGLHPEHAGAITASAALGELEPLRLELVRLEAWQRGDPPRPWSHRWGLYQGDAAYAALRKAYFARIREAFLAPAAQLLAADLQASVARGGGGLDHFSRMFEQFYALSMLTGRLPANDRLAIILSGKGGAVQRDYWLEGVFHDGGLEGIDQETRRMALEHLDYLVGQARRQDEWALTDWVQGHHPGLLEEAESQLRSADDWAGYSYTRLERDIEQAKDQTTLDDPVGLLTTAPIEELFAYAEQPRKRYSQAVFDDDILPQIRGQAQQLEDRFRALGDRTIDAAEFRDRFLDRYAKGWSADWHRALTGLEVRPAATIHEARKRLEIIAGDDSPYAQLLRQIAERQVLRVDGLDERNQPGFDPGGDWLTASRAQLTAVALALDAYLSQTAAGTRLHKVDELKALAEAMTQARTAITEATLGIADADVREAIRAHFDQMLTMAGESVGTALAADADHLWETSVVGVFAQGIGRRFPFDPDAPESVSVAAYRGFFDPDQGAVATVRRAVEACRAVTFMGRPIIALGGAYDGAMARLAEMAALFPPGADGQAPGLAARVRFVQYPGVEDIALSVGEARLGLWDRPDRRGGFTWTLSDDLVTRAAIRVERDRWLEVEARQDPWGPLRIIAAARASGAVERVDGATEATWLLSDRHAVRAPAAPAPADPVPAPVPDRSASEPQPRSAVETAVAPDVAPDPVPAVDNPPKQRAPSDTAPVRPASEPVAPRGFVGEAKTGGAMKVGPPKSVEPAATADPRPVHRRDQYRMGIVFEAPGIEPSPFDLDWLGGYAPPASIRQVAR